MLKLTIIWLALSLLVGFGIYLWPKSDRPLALFVPLASLLYGLTQVFSPFLNITFYSAFWSHLIVCDIVFMSLNTFLTLQQQQQHNIKVFLANVGYHARLKIIYHIE